MTQFKYSLPLLGAVALLASCGGSDSGSNGELSVQLTDAKVDEALAVVLHYTQVTIHGDGGDRVVDVFDPLTGDPGRSINLMDYTNGNGVLLFEETLPAGNYSWMRLDVDFDPALSYIELADGQHPLSCTSCENNGVKLNRSFTIDADQTTAFTLDFDLRSSITYSPGSNQYHLRPTVRMIETAASGAIAGSVDPTLIASLGSDGSHCVVYVYNGQDAVVDDIYLPMSGPVPDTQNNPQITAMMDPVSNTYTAAFLLAGDYTVSLTCEADLDDPLTDDVLTFTGDTNAAVTAGATTVVDFN